jgi:hypothetical protein
MFLRRHGLILSLNLTNRGIAMWWTEYQHISSAAFFGPVMWFLLMVVCTTGVFFVTGMGKIEADPTGRHLSADRPGTSEKYREKYREKHREATLRRVDQEEREFMALVSHLRAARDKTEFDQFMSKRRAPSSSLQV